MTAWMVALWRGERSFPGRYVVIAYVLTWVIPNGSPLIPVVGVLMGLSLALFFVRPPAWFLRAGDRVFGGDGAR
jgi:hypothetical protein